MIAKIKTDEPSLDENENIFYSMDLNPANCSVTLKEHISGLKGELVAVIARNFGWRAKMIRTFCRALENRKQDCVRPFGSEEHLMSYDPVIASRIFVAQKIVSAIKDEKRAGERLELVLDLPDAETAYWAWKIAASKKKAISAFNILISGESINYE